MKVNADIIIGIGTAKNGSLVPAPNPKEKAASTRKRKRFLSKFIQYM